MLHMVTLWSIAGYMTVHGGEHAPLQERKQNHKYMDHELTEPLSCAFSPEASASYPTIKAISCTNV
jgi:hypothetical protein